MSYSFTVRAATKAAAIELATAEMDRVVAAQPVHELDARSAMTAAEAFVALLPDDAEQDVRLSVNGSVGWSGLQGEADMKILSTNVSVSASLAPRDAV